MGKNKHWYQQEENYFSRVKMFKFVTNFLNIKVKHSCLPIMWQISGCGNHKFMSFCVRKLKVTPSKNFLDQPLTQHSVMKLCSCRMWYAHAIGPDMHAESA